MVSINRVRVVWDGLGGLPGLTTFYLNAASTDTSAILTFFSSIKSLCPAPLTWTVPSSGDIIEAETGTLTGGWSGTGGGSTASVVSGNYAGGVGARIKWGTSSVKNGRRVAGATFCVPLLASQYDAAGTLGSGTVTTLQGAANTLLAAGINVGVWSRPTPGTSDGIFVAYQSAQVPDRVSWLRTRRT